MQILGDRYEVKQQLSRNGGRQTLLAKDLHTQELVVVKLLSFDRNLEWEHLKLFEREAETLKALSHPAIPRYLDYIELDTDGAKFALVETYVEGKSLEEYLKLGRSFSEDEVYLIANILLEILVYLHERQPPIIHRDIKPSNIILSAGSGNSVERVYLVDFGSVQIAAREGKTITVVGTYGYMPPEQFGGRTVPASDLYSLGATLITLITGTHPADLPQKEGRIQFEQAGLSFRLSHWLRRMSEPSLDRRLTTAREARRMLEQQSSHTVIVKQPTGSKVVIAKGMDSLNIVIPPAKFGFNLIFLYVFTLLWNSFIYRGLAELIFMPFPASIALLLLLPFLGIGIFLGIQTLFTSFGRVRFQINHQQISLTYKLFNFKYSSTPLGRRQDITKIEYIKKYFKRNEDGDVLEINPQLNVWAGAYKYSLNARNLLTEPELEWLAEELSDWLGMVISL